MMLSLFSACSERPVHDRTVISIEPSTWQPFASTPITEYDVLTLGLAKILVVFTVFEFTELIQEQLLAPKAVRIRNSFVQIVFPGELDIVAGGAALIFTGITSCDVQPDAFVPITV